MKKNIFIIVLALVMVLAAGCSANDNTTSRTDDSQVVMAEGE